MGARTQTAIARKGGPIIGIPDVEITRDSSKWRWSVLPEKLAETGVEALELDVTNVFLELVPMSLGIPLEQQAQDMSMGVGDASRSCRYLPHDRDTMFCQLFRELIKIHKSAEVLSFSVAATRKLRVLPAPSSHYWDRSDRH
jgi:hypothetical protein